MPAWLDMSADGFEAAFEARRRDDVPYRGFDGDPAIMNEEFSNRPRR